MSISFGPKLGLIIDGLQGDAHYTAILALFRALDQLPFLSVINRTTTAPPGSPANGDAYIVATGGSGAWAGHDKSIAVWTTDNPAALSGEWEFYVPKAGWIAFSVLDAGFYSYSGTAWAAFAGGGAGATQAGVEQNAYVYAADTGAANAYVVTLSPVPTIVNGSEVIFKATSANTGASTLAVNGGSATAIKKNGSAALASGDIAAGQIISVVYDGTNFQIQGGTSSGASGPTVNPQTASYTAVLGDGNNLVTMNVASANNFTVPPHSSVAFAVGTTLTIIQIGAGQTTLVAGAGVTVNNPSSLTARARYSTVSLTQIATDTWIAAGDLT
jgi:Protein of unknown function (DUF2793)